MADLQGALASTSCLSISCSSYIARPLRCTPTSATMTCSSRLSVGPSTTTRGAMVSPVDEMGYLVLKLRRPVESRNPSGNTRVLGIARSPHTRMRGGCRATLRRAGPLMEMGTRSAGVGSGMREQTTFGAVASIAEFLEDQKLALLRSIKRAGSDARMTCSSLAPNRTPTSAVCCFV